MVSVSQLDIYRKDFPILTKNRSVYLNNAFTGLTPLPVIKKIYGFYTKERMSSGPYNNLLDILDISYQRIARFIGSVERGRNVTDGIAYAECGTDAINLIANGLNEKWKKNDNIIISQIEYAANAVPWERMANRHKIKIRIAECNKLGHIPLEAFRQKIDRNTKLIAVVDLSNLTGERLPVNEISKVAHEINPECHIFVDGAQSLTHVPVDVRKIKCDFFAFSGHKAMSCTHGGGVWIRNDLIKKIIPAATGNTGIVLSEDGSEYNFREGYRRFWTGISDFEGIFSLGWIFEYLRSFARSDPKPINPQDLDRVPLNYSVESAMKKVQNHNDVLLKYLKEGLDEYEQKGLITIYGPEKTDSLISFKINKKMNMSLDNFAKKYFYNKGIVIQALKTAEFPYMQNKIKVEGLIRISVQFYNNINDIEKFLDAMKFVKF